MGEKDAPTQAITGSVKDALRLGCCAIGYTILSTCLTATEGEGSTLEKARGRRDPKEMISLALYIAGIVLAFFVRYLSLACYLAVAVIWFLGQVSG